MVVVGQGVKKIDVVRERFVSSFKIVVIPWGKKGVKWWGDEMMKRIDDEEIKWWGDCVMKELNDHETILWGINMKKEQHDKKSSI